MSAEILNSGYRKARKRHICDWCGEVIEKGEEYYYKDCVDDTERRIWTIKEHEECEDAFNETLDDCDCESEKDEVCETILMCAGRKRGQKYEY